MPTEGSRSEGRRPASSSNMEASASSVPTATSVRDVPAKLLEVNRKILNNHLSRTRGGKVSFTHLIGYAIVKALDAVPAMNATFGRRRTSDVDHPRAHRPRAGRRRRPRATARTRCWCPASATPTRSTSRAFWHGIRGAHPQGPDEQDQRRRLRRRHRFASPIPAPSARSIRYPSLMPGQGVIIGVGAIDYPAEYQAADPRMLAQLGVSKVITLTSTYDHRIIQGAESGDLPQITSSASARRGRLLRRRLPRHGRALRAGALAAATSIPSTRSWLISRKQVHVQTLINMYRVRGHLIADLDPLAVEGAAHSTRARPGHLRPDDLGPRPRVLSPTVSPAAT